MAARKRAVGPEHPDFPHGEMRGYRRGCRCDACKEANRLNWNDYQERKAAGKVKPKRVQ